jgi:hypothetical protein
VFGELQIQVHQVRGSENRSHHGFELDQRRGRGNPIVKFFNVWATNGRRETPYDLFERSL